VSFITSFCAVLSAMAAADSATRLGMSCRCTHKHTHTHTHTHPLVRESRGQSRQVRPVRAC
jgi:hypothetical protein